MTAITECTSTRGMGTYRNSPCWLGSCFGHLKICWLRNNGIGPGAWHFAHRIWAQLFAEEDKLAIMMANVVPLGFRKFLERGNSRGYSQDIVEL